MPLQVTTSNTYMENFIGAPVPRYDPGDDECVAIYNIFKPLILDFFQVCNNPTLEKNRIKLRLIMLQVKLIYYTHGDPFFFQEALNSSLIPPPVNGEYNAAWIASWYTMLFEQGDAALSVVIQGGEAVNYYTANKYENVPTHDADTRVLAGNHFNYLTKVEDVHIVAKDAMHRYRFFLTFGLMAYLRSMTNYAGHQNGLTLYTSQFIPQWTQQATLTFDVQWSCGIDFYELIRNGLYGGLGNDVRIARLLSVGVRVQVGAFDYHCYIVDYMCPSQYPGNPGEHHYDTSRNRLGQSDNLHSYFATAQAISTSDDGITPPNPAGHIPFVNVPLTIDPAIPLLGNLNGPSNLNPIQLRMVPLGFIIFETIRMMFVSKLFQSNNIEHKMMKYKQKLNVLLSTLMREQTSRAIYDICIGHKTRVMPPAGVPPLNPENNAAEAPDLQRLLLGGGSSVPTICFDAREAEETQKHYDKKMLAEASAFAQELLEKEEAMNKASLESGKRMSTRGLPEPKEMTPPQELGYMHYLSGLNADFKDFRLPLQTKPKEKPLSKEAETLLNQAIEAVMGKPQTLKGNYRRKTPRTTKTKGPRTTRRKTQKLNANLVA